MQSTVVTSILVSVAAVSVMNGVCGGQVGRETMGDPLFGILYDVAKVHFERAPSSVSQLCSELHGRRGMWLYAAWETPQAHYLVISGLIQVHSDGPSKEPPSFEPDGGVAVELRGTECRLSSVDWLFSEKVNPDPRAPRVTQQTLNGLVSDALRRYAAAFGGRQNFIREIEKSHVALNDLSPVLRHQLQAFMDAK
jgi:hypothetical protein